MVTKITNNGASGITRLPTWTLRDLLWFTAGASITCAVARGLGVFALCIPATWLYVMIGTPQHRETLKQFRRCAWTLLVIALSQAACCELAYHNCGGVWAAFYLVHPETAYLESRR